MTVTYTFDIFASLDGYGSHTGDWGGYWGKHGPEWLARRIELIESRTFDGRIQELTYQPSLHLR